MILALIKNNIIINTIIADDELIAVNYPDYFVMRIDTLDPVPGIGDTWDGEKFVKPIVEVQE
jgi:hypothetical protein